LTSPSAPYVVPRGKSGALRHHTWCFAPSPVQQSGTALAEGERKVNRGLIGAPSAVPRIHLPNRAEQVTPEAPSPSTCRAWSH